MNIVCVIHRGEHLAHTLASIRFNKHGRSLTIPYVMCDTWQEGFNQVSAKYEYGLFIHSGTVFYDIESFIQELKNYPQQGIVAHIVDPLDSEYYYYIHPQCFLLKLDQYDANDFINQDTLESCIPIRSEKNIHSNYTPLWLKKSHDTKSYKCINFGSQLIHKTLAQGKVVSNFTHTLRTKKLYLYDQKNIDIWLDYNQAYIALAKEQLWIFNNEPIHVNIQSSTITCPASGLFWAQAAQNSIVANINLVDISSIQIKFAQDLLDNWDGNDYGGFVIDFMKSNNLKHFCLDKDLTKLERLHLANKDRLRNYINERTPIINIDLIRSKNIKFFGQSIIDFVEQNNVQGQIWMSNILDYKLTYLTHSYEYIDNFKKKLVDKKL